MLLKPISVTAFLLTVVAVVLILLGICLPSWYHIYRNESDKKGWYGLWAKEECQNLECYMSSTSSIEGGKEFVFICKVFAGLAAGLSGAGLVLHVLYIPLRVPLIRQVAIYLLGAAGLFLLLSTLIFVAMYKNLRVYTSQQIALGAAFYISLIASLVCLVASSFTAWASVRKANSSDEDDRIQITEFEEEKK